MVILCSGMFSSLQYSKLSKGIAVGLIVLSSALMGRCWFMVATAKLEFWMSLMAISNHTHSLRVRVGGASIVSVLALMVVHLLSLVRTKTSNS